MIATHLTRAALLRTIASDWSAIRAKAVAKGARRCRTARLPQTPKILGSSAKTIKGEAIRIKSAVAYLSPSVESGYDTCRNASKACRKACLVKSGQLGMAPALNARLWKTALALGAPKMFRALLAFEIAALARAARAEGFTPAIRLDGTSDLGIAATLAQTIPGVQFYDYTKDATRALKHAKGELAPNYHVTFSYSGWNRTDALAVLAAGGNVAVAFDVATAIKGRRDAGALPTSWEGYRVIDGDETDARFLDDSGVVVGLRFKGEANRAARIKAAGAFVVRAREPKLLPRA